MQIRRKKWSLKNRDGNDSSSTKSGDYGGVLDIKDDGEYDYGRGATPP